jgi:drug/metabolite transporter (DMT)-like permease
MVAALAIWAAYSLALRRPVPGVPPLALHTATSIAGLGWLLPAYGAGLLVSAPVALTWSGALAIGYIAVFASAIAFLIWIRAVGQIGPTRAGMFIHLMPVFGAILAVAFLGERIAAFHVAGAALVFAGLVVANRRPASR